MSAITPLWISEADVVELLSLQEAIPALERGLELQAQGTAHNMAKTHITWGAGNTLHSLGAAFEPAGVVGVKSWAHTHQGATPLLLMWDGATGRLRAIIEAFALGQMRTAAVSAVATRWMARPNADTFALIGTGKQALAQLAAVAAVRPLRQVKVFSPTPERRQAFIASLAAERFPFEIVEAASVADAAAGSAIITLVTRARQPFLSAEMIDRGAHINAIGAITPEREELMQNVFARAGLIVADDPAATRRLSREFTTHFGDSTARWQTVTPLSALVAARHGRPDECDVSLFKAMGMGVCDLALGLEVLERALASGRGRPLPAPARARPRLHASSQTSGSGR
jgi:alanine dehydrogenase